MSRQYSVRCIIDVWNTQRERETMVSYDSSMAVMMMTAILMLAVSTLFCLMARRRRGPPLPPGPVGLPILGCLPFLQPDLHRYFARLAQTYGPVLSLRIGTRLCVVLSSPAVAREALKDNDLTFASHDAPEVASRTMLGRSDMLWIPYGPVWRLLRKVSVQELLSPRRIEAIRPLRRREVRRTIARLRAGAGEPVEVREVVYLTAMNVMTKILWGVTLDGEDDGDRTKKELLRVVEEVIQLLGEANISDFIPALGALDLQGFVRKMDKLMGEYQELQKRVTEKRTARATAAVAAAKEEEEKTFYEVMIELVERDDPQAPLNMAHTSGLLLDMLAGGMDTTATTTEWAMAELLRHPHIKRRAQEELDAVVGAGRAVEESDLPKLAYLDAVVKETMRLHPVIPLLVPYSAASACVVGGYAVPPGAKVFVNVWAIHRDPSVWGERSLEFDPERFSAAAVEAAGGRRHDYNGKDFEFLPFGSGRRICAGVSLGERMVMYTLASLLHSFDWRLPGGAGEVDVTERFGIVMKKAEPLRAVPTPRLYKPELYM